MKVEAPDYEFWFKNDAFNRDELGLLIVGVNPASALGRQMADAYEGQGDRAFRRKFRGHAHIIQLHERYLAIDSLIFRSLEGGAFRHYASFNSGYVPRTKAIEFALGCDGLSHAFLEAASKFTPSARQKSAGEEQPKAKPLLTKERETALKLIIGMAVDSYHFDATAPRNEATAKIARALEDLGIGIDPDTVRKWLREGAELLPPKKS